jgi:hypothetical protein
MATVYGVTRDQVLEAVASLNHEVGVANLKVTGFGSKGRAITFTLGVIDSHGPLSRTAASGRRG